MTLGGRSIPIRRASTLRLIASVLCSCLGAILLAQNGASLDEIGKGVRNSIASLQKASGSLRVDAEYPLLSGEDLTRKQHPVFGESGDYKWWFDNGQLLTVKSAKLTRSRGPYVQNRIFFFDGDSSTDFTTIVPAEGVATNGDLIRGYHLPFHPLIGYFFGAQSLAQILDSLQDPSVSTEGPVGNRKFVVDGKVNDSKNWHLVVDESAGFIATDATLTEDEGPTGDVTRHYQVLQTSKVANICLPKKAAIEVKYLPHVDNRYELTIEGRVGGLMDKSWLMMPKGTRIVDARTDEDKVADGNGNLLPNPGLRRKGRPTSAIGPLFTISAAIVLVSGLTWLFGRRRPHSSS